MSSSADTFQPVTERICRFLTRDMQVDEHARQFVESTLGVDSLAELKAIIHDRHHPEQECVLELVFSPTQDQRLELEPLLQDIQFSDQDVSVVIQRTWEQCRQAQLSLPDGSGINLDLSLDMVQTYVRRLHLQRSPPSFLQKAVQELPASWRTWLLVRMRSASTPLIGSRAEFLASFFTSVPVSSSLFEPYFEFALTFVQECAPDADMEQALARKKETLEHSLDKADFLERQRQRHAMETLLMQRLPMLHIDVTAARQALQMIDDLSLALYGRIFNAPAHASQDISFPSSS